MSRAIAVDFDGVIHTYDKGWQNGNIYGGLMPGAVAGLRVLMQKYAVFIHTSRSPRSVAGWLASPARGGFVTSLDERCDACLGHGTRAADDDVGDVICDVCAGTGELRFWSQKGVLLVTNKKYPAIAYIDDRAVRFTSWSDVKAAYS